MNTPLFENETIQHLREDTTDSFQEVERALQDVENRTMTEINKLKFTKPVEQDRDPGFIIPKFVGTQGNLVMFDGLGNLTDDNISVNDYSEPSPFVLYSSEKHNKDLRKTLETISNTLPNNKMNLVPEASFNSIASFDSKGQVKSSGISVIGIKQISESAQQAAQSASEYAKQANDSASAAMKIVQNGGGGSTISFSGTPGNVPIYNSSGIQDSKISSNSLMLKSIPKQNNSLAVLDSNGQIKDSLYGINDSIKNPNVLWSSSNIDSIFQKKLPGNDTIPLLSTSGDLTNSNIRIDDKVSSPNVLWTSDKMKSMFTGNGLAKMTTSGVLYDTGIDPSNLLTKITNSTDGNLSAINSGTIYDSGYSIRDNLNADKNIIWSSNKIDLNYIKKLSGNYTVPYISPDGQLIDSNQTMENFIKITKPSESGNLPVLDKSGQLIDSNFRIDDSLNSLNTVWSSKKNDSSYIKLLSGTNLAQLGSDGQLRDSGISVNNFVQKIIPSTPGSFTMLDSSGQIIDSGFSIKDTNPASSTILWSAKKIDDSYIKKLSGNYTVPYISPDGQLIDSKQTMENFIKITKPSESGNLPVLDKSGQLIDSNFRIDDSLNSLNTVWSSKKNDSSYIKLLSGTNLAQLGLDGQLHDSGLNPTNVMQKTIPKENGSIAFLDANGQVSDSGFVVQDNQSGLDVLWSTTKNNETFMKKLSGDLTVPLLNIDGQLIDSNVNLSNVMLKSDNNYIRKTAPLIQNSLLVKSPDGNLQENNIIIDDSKPASANVVWTSNKVQQNFVTLPLPNTDGNILQYDSTGKIISANPKLTFFSLSDNTWSPFSTDLYITAIVVKTGSTYCIKLASSIDFIPAHNYVLIATCVFAQGINTPCLVAQKKLYGTIPYYKADSINICLLGSEVSPWQFTADDKIDIFFIDKTNKKCFKIICIIKGFDTSNIVTIERMN